MFVPHVGLLSFPFPLFLYFLLYLNMASNNIFSNQKYSSIATSFVISFTLKKGKEREMNLEC